MAIRCRCVDTGDGAQSLLPRVPSAAPIARCPPSSAGSRWPRFPVFNSTMKALRLPTLRPSGLLFSLVSTMCARSICVVARALPMPRGQVVGPGLGLRPVAPPTGHPSHGQCRPLRFPGDPFLDFAAFSDPGGSVRRLACSGASGAAPMTVKHKGTLAIAISRLNSAASSPPVYASRRTLPHATQHSVPVGWLGLCGRELNPLDHDEGFQRFQVILSPLPELS